MRGALTSVVAALALVLVPLGAAETSYGDPAGDSGSGPDIMTVTLSNTADGVVTVRAAVSMVPWTLVGMAIDSDRNPSTGELGIDGLVMASMAGVPSDITAVAFDDEWDEIPGVEISPTFEDGVLAFSFAREVFAIDESFAFGLLSVTRADGDGDVAPLDPCWTVNVSCRQLWVYELTGVSPAFKPVIGRVVTTPRQPIAGKRFTVRFPVTRSDNGMPVTNAAVTCTTRIAGKVVPHRHLLANGAVTATLTVPSRARGRPLQVAVKVTTGTQAATRVVTFTIR